MARGKSKQQQAATAAADADAPLPKGAVVDAQSDRVFVPVDTVSSDLELPQSTDSVADALAGNYSEGIVDEVRKYAKPEWDVDTSSLDPLDDIDVFLDYDLKLPPEDYDAYQAVAKLKLDELEALKGQPDAPTAAKIAARKELVKGKTADELRWLKHKAYYRGIQRIRAGKAADAAAEAQEAAAPQQQQQSQQQPSQQPPSQQQQQQQQRYAHLSEDEVLAAVSEPSEWDLSWTGSDYSRHPQVLQQLRTTFSNGFGLPPYQSAAQQEAEVEATWQAAKAAEAAAQQQAEAEEAAKQALLAKYMPYQAYTPQYLEQQRRERTLASHRRTKQQAFWLSLGLALGSSAYRWWQQRGSGGKRRRGSVAGQRQGSGSRRSTRPPTPSTMQIQGAIAE